MDVTSKIKVGVIGTGALGRHHARLYAQSPNAEMVGIFDVNKEAAEKVANEFGLPLFSDWKELAAACDALSVAVPATYHSSTVIPLLDMGKHVLVEKPIDAGVAGAAAMCAAAEKNGVVLGVGHVERFNPCMDYLEKTVGTPRFIEAKRLAGYPPARPGLPRRGTEVSVILDLMIHDIDLVLRLMNSEIERFDAIGTPVLSDSEDIVNVRIKFVDGSCAVLTASRISSEPERTLRVIENDRCTVMDFGKHCGTVLTRGKSGLEQLNVELPEKNALAEELEDFIAAVRKTGETGKVQPCRVSAVHGLKALELATAIESEVRRYNKEYNFEIPAWSTDEMA